MYHFCNIQHPGWYMLSTIMTRCSISDYRPGLVPRSPAGWLAGLTSASALLYAILNI